MDRRSIESLQWQGPSLPTKGRSLRQVWLLQKSVYWLIGSLQPLHVSKDGSTRWSPLLDWNKFVMMDRIHKISSKKSGCHSLQYSTIIEFLSCITGCYMVQPWILFSELIIVPAFWRSSIPPIRSFWFWFLSLCCVMYVSCMVSSYFFVLSLLSYYCVFCLYTEIFK